MSNFAGETRWTNLTKGSVLTSRGRRSESTKLSLKSVVAPTDRREFRDSTAIRPASFPSGVFSLVLLRQMIGLACDRPRKTWSQAAGNRCGDDHLRRCARTTDGCRVERSRFPRRLGEYREVARGSRRSRSTGAGCSRTSSTGAGRSSTTRSTRCSNSAPAAGAGRCIRSAPTSSTTGRSPKAPGAWPIM